MTRNQLPEGVGKKIVEALKRQAEADITPVDTSENKFDTNIPLTDIKDLPEINTDNVEVISDTNDNIIIEEESSNIELNEQVQNKEPVIDKKEQSVMENPVFNTFTQPKTSSYINQPIKSNEETYTNAPISIPANVAILKNLISSLPVGVTKQTGAQIIRQTLEAMGLPMNSVLKEAQDIQEQLNSSTRECMLKIQEYKTKILQLEQSVQEYQKNITQINDLVSLFLLTDRKQ